MMQHHTTIVVGAGIAGLAAARDLHDAGCAVKVLEARNRLGGRTHTDTTLGPSIDMGASWIHGPSGNPLMPLARQFDLRWDHTDFVNLSGSSVLAFNADGSPLDMVAYSTGLQLAAGVAAHAWGSVLYTLPAEGHRSLADLYAYGLPGLTGLTPDERKGYEYSAVTRVQYGAGADLDEIDWRLSEEYIELPGGDMLLYGGGYQRMIEGLAAGLKIDTEVVVEAITYDGDGVQLRTSHGMETGGHVILTAPLGVLKAGTIHFSPALPAAKQAAIAQLGFGNYEKLALKFPHQFWPREPQRFNYLTDQRPELFTSWLNLAHYTDDPILIAHHAGSRAQATNGMSDPALIEAALAALRVMFAGTIPEPVAYLRSGWENDPWARGSYSFRKVGGSPDDIPRLAQSVADRVFFAGEATHPHYFGTVHGAYETGIRAAREVMARIR